MAINISRPSASLPRNAFDLSQRNIFTSRAGLVTPVLALDCVPGDYHEIDLLSLTRTMPVKTDAFTALRQNFNFIFVPYQQLWRFWNDFSNQSNERFSTLEGIVQSNDLVPFTIEAVPTFDLFTLLVDLQGIFYGITDSVGGRRVLRTGTTATGNTAADYLAKIDGTLRLLDMLGYGSFYEFVYSTSDVYDDSTVWDDLIPKVKPNMFRLAAYQKAWNDYYRNSTYQDNIPMSFNLDWLHGTSAQTTFNLSEFTQVASVIHSIGSSPGDFAALTISPDDAWRSIQPFELRHAPWQRDKFSTMYPQPQFGSVSGVSFSGVQISNDATRSYNLHGAAVVVQPLQSDAPGLLTRTNEQSTSNWSINNAFSVYELRYAQYLQKWKEDKMRAGKKTKDIAMAIFGERPKYSMDQYSDFVDNFVEGINISEVTSMSGTSENVLGDIAGKGVSAGSHTVKFKCSDFGVLLCLYDVTPSVEYNAKMLDKQNTLIELDDFWNPYFMDMGFEAITASELSLTGDPSTNTPYNHNYVLGYAPHDQCYKQSVNKVHGEFMSGRTLSHWVTPRTKLYNQIVNGSVYNIDALYVDPSDIDAIFYGQSNNPSYGSGIFYQEYDQFLNNFNFDIKSVRNMSVLGLPRW